MIGTVPEVYAALVGIGAAIGAHCEPCLAHHVEAARGAGLAEPQVRAAVAAAERVRERAEQLGQGAPRSATDTRRRRCCG